MSKHIIPLLCCLIAYGGPNAVAAEQALQPPAQRAAAVEQLWAINSTSYFVTARTTGVALLSMTNAEARAAARTMLSNVVEKLCPTNDRVQAKNCFAEKRRTVFSFVGGVEKLNDQAAWLQMATFLGEVRSARVPNYSRRYDPGKPLPGNYEYRATLTNDEARAAFDNVTAENQANWDLDRLQDDLWSLDALLEFQLRNACSRLRTDEAEYRAFVEQVATAAHLTSEEKAALLATSR